MEFEQKRGCVNTSWSFDKKIPQDTIKLMEKKLIKVLNGDEKIKLSDRNYLEMDKVFIREMDRVYAIHQNEGIIKSSYYYCKQIRRVKCVHMLSLMQCTIKVLIVRR